MPETRTDFASELRVSMTPVVVALAITAVIPRIFGPGDTSGRGFSLLFSFVIGGVAALAQPLEHWNPSLGRWFLVGSIGVLLCVWSAQFEVPEALCLLMVPTALAAALISLPAALITTVSESVFLIAVLWSAPLSTTLSARPAILWVTLILTWITYVLMVAVYQPVYSLARWSWAYYQEGLSISGTAQSRQAELLQAVDDLTYANRQLALAEKRVIAQRSIAEEAQQAKAAFVARVSHEFRAPLNIIIGMINLMVETPELYDGAYPPQAVSHLRIVYRTCRHLSGMIDDVLDMSQAESGRMVLHYTEVNLADVLHPLIELVQPTMTQKGLTCQVEVPPTLPVVACDVVRIRQIVLNLLSNATRLTERGGITVRAEQEGASVLLSVIDTGPGIDPEDARRIFEPYYRSSAAPLQWQANKGSGLGLSISKQLVTLHGGEMWLESTVGVGTAFCVRLPFSPPRGPAEVPSRWIQREWEWHARQSRPKFVAAHYKPRVVVCDQGGGLYGALSRVSDRVELVETRTPSEALAVLQSSVAQALLLNGDSVSALWADASEVARQAPDIPVIGCVCPAHIAQRQPSQVLAYLTKPVTRDGLHAAIDSIAQPVERVLIVEDAAYARELLSFYVRAYDVAIDVEVAESGEQALAALQTVRPDLILLDLTMGEVDGWQVLDAKLKMPEVADVPVIIITAQDPTPGPPKSQVLLATMGGGISPGRLIDSAAALSMVMIGEP